MRTRNKANEMRCRFFLGGAILGRVKRQDKETISRLHQVFKDRVIGQAREFYGYGMLKANKMHRLRIDWTEHLKSLGFSFLAWSEVAKHERCILERCVLNNKIYNPEERYYFVSDPCLPTNRKEGAEPAGAFRPDADCLDLNRCIVMPESAALKILALGLPGWTPP